MIIIGIDVGISTTKIVGIDENGEIMSPTRIKATDPVTSLYGAFGKYLYDNHVQLEDIRHVMITGVGAAYIDGPVYGLPTEKANEFIADGLGARYETDLDRMLVVSMGTGTSLVQCDGNDIRHIGGIGIGGGTLTGLSRIMLKTDDVKHIVALAQDGELSNIDVQIGDISPNPLPGLPKNATASLFGNAKSNATREDIALGIITTVLQTIGSSCILASIGSGIKEYVLIGNLTLLPQCKIVFPAMEKLYNVRFIIPQYSEFCTAIGAALSFFHKE
ncbi:MAG: type II pantothenate kinase [Prevotella sp.]|nr:type II pantothenate kinase [Prevotella sp.]MCI6619507.1 type II pantothenate kinase [Prevotella sp.]MDY4038906.1 type II pantothenate kinase [Prevotella sp.]